MKEHTFDKIGTTEKLFYEIKDLQKDTIYYVRITAENELGEGYLAEPFLARTAPFSETDLCSLYTWGFNSCS